MNAPSFVEVALPLPIFQTFTYTVESASLSSPGNPLVAGARVVVPVRNRRAVGVCLGPATGEGVTMPRPVLDVPDADPALSPAMLSLCHWLSEYYIVPVGQVFRSVLPSVLTLASAPRPAQKSEGLVVLQHHMQSLAERDRIFARAPRQRELLELLESVGGKSTVQHLTERLGFSRAVIRALAGRGTVRLERAVVSRDPFLARARLEPTHHTPTTRQREAVDELVAAPKGTVALLYGVTGSGKTLVYVELLREIVEKRGQSAIVLVPEISLTPQTVDRFRSAFGDRIAVLHSALSDGERYDAWLALKRGEKSVAVGARSAIFAPLRNLGAIIVDEEHEGSYKNGETPRYHAREVAIVRAQLEGAVVVLGSATPSLESWHNAEQGKYRLLELPERVGAGSLPAVEVVDLRTRGGIRPNRVDWPSRRVLTNQLEQALANRLSRKEQTILLLNRRGYASFVQCQQCGDVRNCPHCSISLTYHRSPERLVCHYCLHEEPPSQVCLRCGAELPQQIGLGTQQAERLIALRFPAARIARMDVDTTSGKWAHAEILDRVASGEVDILLGTQMIAKGLDFPNVTLVGVIDADVGINLPDFRASERSYQLLSQVAGRAGRGPKGGNVIIQTRMPDHHSVRFAVTHDYRGFVSRELESRRDPAYPPFTRLANVIVSGHSENATAELALSAHEWIDQLIVAGRVREMSIVGPAPCAISRIKRRWRWHLLLKSSQPAALTRVLRYFLDRFEVPGTHDLRVVVDRDPVALL